MKCVFLIVNYNDFLTTKKLIDNIKTYDIIDKILIIDNHSTDNSYENLKKIKDIEVIKNESNLGYGSAINLGIKHIQKLFGEAKIIVSNSDIEVTSEKVLIRLLENMDKDTAIIAPVIKENGNLNRGWKFPSPGQEILMNIVYLHRFLRPKFIFYSDDFYKQDLVQVDAVSGCFFVIDSKLIKEAGYFDENVFLYYEENIIGKKIKNINKKILLLVDVFVLHNHSQTIDKNFDGIKKYKIQKESQAYFQKNYNNASKFDIILLYLTNKFTLCLLTIRNLFFRRVK